MEERNEIEHVKIIVKGYVQGVSFRAYTRRKANDLGLTGYVKNLRNGNVEVVAEGPQSKLYKLIIWFRKEGSPASQVEEVIVEWIKKIDNYNTFRIVF
jgi:acylphosphatase